ncbi:synaptotagmin-2 isoform X2 [Nelusetta ayraudi]|uniref:synaptotagmin-2 isoform X2 n=1 Tax=Nelusetta ayraudi TaxID=303726 RepID=UPI003F724EA5
MPQLMDKSVPVVPWLGAPDLRPQLSERIQYLTLGISVVLLLLALGVLAWQAYRCCANTTYTNKANSNLQDQKSRTEVSYARGPQVCRLSHCLSQGLVPPSSFNQTGITKVDGSLRFSIYYEEPHSQLVVSVLQAEGLVESNLQAFVKIILLWPTARSVEIKDSVNKKDGETEPVLWAVLHQWQTHIVKGSRNLLFGDQFSCILQENEELHHISLKMEVRDFDNFSRQTVLGEVRIPLEQLNISYPIEMLKDLQPPQKDLVGQVLLSLKFLPTSQRLEIGVLKVRTALTGKCSDAALFVKIRVQCNQCKLRSQKTSTVAQSLMTVFNDVLLFPLQELPLQECKIVVSVYNTYMTKRPTRYLVGQFTVGRDDQFEDEHWRLMMHSIRQPIARWHGLLI